jgi:two-component system, cell cycle sensor histidine kinase and response regulator CckA
MSGSPHNHRVLLVDSDYRTSSRLAAMLRDDGFEVDVVRDGAAAIAQLARGPLPDTLVTELKVRVADGVSVARYARAQRPDLQVVVLTGHPHLLKPGALGSGEPPLVLTKPLDYALLLSALTGPIAEQGLSLPQAASGTYP